MKKPIRVFLMGFVAIGPLALFGFTIIEWRHAPFARALLDSIPFTVFAGVFFGVVLYLWSKTFPAPTCRDCKHYQDTGLETYDSLDADAKPTGTLFDCPYASDWCEADTEINTLCDWKFQRRERI